MKKIELQEIIKAIGGTVISGHQNPAIHYVSRRSDSTLWKNHTMFFHPPGEKNLHIHSSIKSAVIITRNPARVKNYGSKVTIVKVENVRRAYWNFVYYYRSLFNIPFISVTGTCGKTTTKEMISWILAFDRKVNKTNKSQNVLAMNLNYLLNVDETTGATVIEAAVSSVGNLQTSCRYFRPQIGVLTSIGIDHLNGFPTFEAYRNEKAKIFSCVGSKGTVIVNSDDKHIRKLDLSRYKGKIIWYGKSKQSEFRIKDIHYGLNGMDFSLYHNRKKYKLFVPGYGEHNVYNAVAAIAVAYKLGVDIIESGRRLKSFKHIERHTQVLQGAKGSTLIDDTWSTNPTSILAALDVLKNISKDKKKIAVIGDIKWLGKHTQKAHLDVGEMVARSDVDFLITIGKDAGLISDRAIELGLNPKQVFKHQSAKEAYHTLNSIINQDTVVLVKTSMKQSFSTLIGKLKAYN
ncbi:UDP-N-acetylmuramoyl-tripeptide--D-alanyl-D-alanine ligase [Bacillus salitolerans]|uniref:UDP-N-acetylmuramoyl-tripeptide--D-alanyl-D-alanine ligase n=1 Tax=Bacillus salitolerans TaxID=1437434 RepID=A0ABW4LKC3_9BACI